MANQRLLCEFPAENPRSPNRKKSFIFLIEELA